MSFTLVAVHLATSPLGVALGATWLEALTAPRSLQHRVLVGSQYAPLLANEPWRLCTTVLLHADAVHLAMNVAAVWVLARVFEPKVGGLRFAAILAIAGVGGSLASLAAGVRLSDGVSGGAFGLLGAAVVFGWRHRPALTVDEQWLFGPVLAAFVVLNLVLSVFLPMVNLAAHVGGVVTGGLLAALPEHPAVEAVEALALGGFLGSCAFGFVTLLLQ